MTRSFVGFGFGAIQAGLFLYEAQRSGAFDKLVVAYRRADLIERIRHEKGFFMVNIAHSDHIERARVGPVSLENVTLSPDLKRLIEAIAGASDLATALGSTADYRTDSPGSVHRLLALGLEQKFRQNGPKAIIYTAENDLRAAQKLKQEVLTVLPSPYHGALAEKVQFLNTVIGKMSSKVPLEDSLAPIVPGHKQAFLVESFSHSLVSPVSLQGVKLKLEVFEEKPDLLPFEAAKLYGHNALHALAAYLGAALGLSYIRELQKIPGMLSFLRGAMLEESGKALLRKYQGIDPLFTPQGYALYIDSLLERMMNPFLKDTVERVGRDIPRKLGWDDRLIGSLRLALGQKILPVKTALGVAAALDQLGQLDTAQTCLEDIWQLASPPAKEKGVVLELVLQACQRFKAWRAHDISPLDRLFDKAP